MPISLEQFVESLSTTGLLSSDEVGTIRENLAARSPQPDAEALARELVKAGKLTKFQASALYQGKAKGLVCGEYVLLEKIGAGGMGQVFKARHRRMKRIVAIKLLAPHLASADKGKAIKRFYQEVELAARLTHPNIVTAYDAGQSGNLHFLVMEFVEGQDLSTCLKPDKRLPLNQTLEIVLQASRGLQYAHAQGIVHRDIKPSNLLMDKQGNVKILDMGLARLEDVMAGTNDPTAAQGLTQSGEVMGTVDFMAPEQARNTRDADARADIYSLGCTLYRLATGRPPFDGQTMIDKILAHYDKPIPALREHCEDASPRLEHAFQRMMAKTPEERFQSMSDVISELEACRADVPEEDHSPLVTDEPLADSGLSSFLNQAAVSGIGLSRKNLPHAQQDASEPVRERMSRRNRNESAKQGWWKDTRLWIGGGSLAVVVLIGIVTVLLTRNKPQQTPAATPSVAQADPATDPSASATTSNEPTSKSSTDSPSKPAGKATGSAFPGIGEAEGTPAKPPESQPPTVATATVPATTVATVSPNSVPALPSPTIPPEGIDPLKVVPGPTPQTPSPPLPNSTAKPEDVAKLPEAPTASGVRVNLLRLIDPKRDAVVGIWEFQNSVLLSPIGGVGNPRIQVPYVLPKEYQLTFVADASASGAGLLNLGIVVGSSCVSFQLTNSGQSCELHNIAGKPNKDNEISKTTLPVCPPSKAVTVVFRVRPNQVVVLLNGKPTLKWKGDPNDLSFNGTFGSGVKRTMPYIGCYNNSHYRITKLDLISLDGLRQQVPAPATIATAMAQLKQQDTALPPNATPGQKAERAVDWHDRASTTADDALRYVLLAEAVKLATAADDVKLTLEIAESFARSFQIDASSTLQTSLNEIVGRSRPVNDRKELLVRFLEAADAQSEVERYSLANLLVKLTSPIVAKSTDADLKKEVRSRELEVEEAQKLFTAAEQASQKLSTTPTDSDANYAVGQYLAIARHDWSGAITHLSQSNVEDVRNAAKLEIQVGKDPSRTGEIGTVWLDAAEKAVGPAKVAYLDRARTWLARGTAGLGKTALAKLPSRFKKVDTDVRRVSGTAFFKRHPLRAFAFGGHWYQYLRETLTWHEARQRCLDMGGDLVAIETPTECQFVYQLAAAEFGSADPFSFWIGATEEGHDRVFTWAQGAPVQFADWNSDEPDSSSLAEVVIVDRVSRGTAQFKWSDRAPTPGYAFVCEWDR